MSRGVAVPIVLAYREEWGYALWLVKEPETQSVRAIDGGLGGNLVEVTAPLEVEVGDVLKLPGWLPGESPKYPLPPFGGDLHGGYWKRRSDVDVFSADDRLSRSDAAVEPVICSCGRISDREWARGAWCDVCTNYGSS